MAKDWIDDQKLNNHKMTVLAYISNICLLTKQKLLAKCNHCVYRDLTQVKAAEKRKKHMRTSVLSWIHSCLQALLWIGVVPSFSYKALYPGLLFSEKSLGWVSFTIPILIIWKPSFEIVDLIHSWNAQS